MGPGMVRSCSLGVGEGFCFVVGYVWEGGACLHVEGAIFGLLEGLFLVLLI